jgi:CBS domain-containing protein
MPTEDIRIEEADEMAPDAPLEGDEGEPEIHRNADVGRAILEARVSDVEKLPPVTLAVDATVAKAIETMRKKKVGAVMVVSKRRPRKLVGIFTERDLLQRVLDKKGYGRLKLEKVMTRDPESLKTKDGLAYALNKMSVGRFRHVPVVDEAGTPVGMLSIRDIIDFVVEVIPETVLNLPPEPELAIATAVDGA